MFRRLFEVQHDPEAQRTDCISRQRLLMDVICVLRSDSEKRETVAHLERDFVAEV